LENYRVGVAENVKPLRKALLESLWPVLLSSAAHTRKSAVFREREREREGGRKQGWRNFSVLNPKILGEEVNLLKLAQGLSGAEVKRE
jgi:hypothetical protein